MSALDQQVINHAGISIALALTGATLLVAVVYQTQVIMRLIRRSLSPSNPLSLRRNQDIAQASFEMQEKGGERNEVYLQRQHNFIEVAYHGFYQYQYKPVPFFNDSTIGELIEMTLYLVLHIICIFGNSDVFKYYDGTDMSFKSTILANRFGYAAIGNTAFVMITATRNNIITVLTGIPFERIIMYHRWCGRMIFYTITAHFVMYLTIWDQVGSIATQVQNYDYNRYGIVAWAFLLLIMLSSYSLVRRMAFEWFYYLHFVSFTGFFIFGILHVTRAPLKLDTMTQASVVGIVFYGLDRIIRFWKSNVEVARVAQFRYMGAGLCRVAFFKASFSYHSGQYVFMCFPQLSQIKWHPFTISSTPSLDNTGKQIVTVHIKDIGDFTKRLVELSKVQATPAASASSRNSQYLTASYLASLGDDFGNGLSSAPPAYGSRTGLNANYNRSSNINGSQSNIRMPATPDSLAIDDLSVRVDGPYGRTGVDFLDHPVAILVGGGIGITPMISEVGYLTRLINKHNAFNLRKVYLVWSIPNEEQYEWFAEELHHIDESFNQSGILTVIVYVTRQKQVSSDFFIPERPNYRQLFRSIQMKHQCDAGVAVCGPKAMVRDVRNASAVISYRDSIFYFHEEVFAF